MLNDYEKNGLKKRFSELFTLLQVLDTIAAAYNKVWDQKYEDAMTEFSLLDLLPMKK